MIAKIFLKTSFLLPWIFVTGLIGTGLFFSFTEYKKSSVIIPQNNDAAFDPTEYGAVKIEKSVKPVANLEPKKQAEDNANLIACNNKKWPPCASGRFYCPIEGDAVCLSVDVDIANSIFCNNKSWNKCPTGQKFNCPSVGDATCTPINQSTVPAGMNQETYNLILTQLTQSYAILNGLLQKATDARRAYDTKLQEYNAANQVLQDEEKVLQDKVDTVRRQYTEEFKCLGMEGMGSDKCKDLKRQYDEVNLQLSEINSKRESLMITKLGIPLIKSSPYLPSYLPYNNNLRLEFTPDGIGGGFVKVNNTTYRYNCPNSIECTFF